MSIARSSTWDPYAKLSERDRAVFRDAERGTPDWAWKRVLGLPVAWQYRHLKADEFRKLLHEIVEHRMWDLIPSEQPYGSLEALIKAETGATPDEITRELSDFVDDVRHTIASGKARAKPAKDGPGPRKGCESPNPNGRAGTDRIDDPNCSKDTRTRVERSLKRISREAAKGSDEAEAALQAYEQGEVSAAEAERRAGIAKPKPSPIEVVRRCIARESAKLTDESDRVKLKAMLLEESQKLGV